MPCFDANNGCLPTAKCRLSLSCRKYLNTPQLMAKNAQRRPATVLKDFWCFMCSKRIAYELWSDERPQDRNTKKQKDWQLPMAVNVWHTAKYVTPQSFSGLCPMEHKRWWPDFVMKDNMQIRTTVNTGQSATRDRTNPKKTHLWAYPSQHTIASRAFKEPGLWTHIQLLTLKDWKPNNFTTPQPRQWTMPANRNKKEAPCNQQSYLSVNPPAMDRFAVCEIKAAWLRICLPCQLAACKAQWS